MYRLLLAKYVKQIIPLGGLNGSQNPLLASLLFWGKIYIVKCIAVNLTDAYTRVANTDPGIDNFPLPSKFLLSPSSQCPYPQATTALLSVTID